MSRYRSLSHSISKINLKTLLIILVSLLIGIVILYRITTKPSTNVSAAWYNDSWQYRQRVDITSSTAPQTSYQTRVSIGTSALVNSGHMKSDCSDIRVTDANGALLNFWLESATCNTPATGLWVKVPSLPSSGATIYVYYGNPSAASARSIIGTSDFPALSCKSILDAGNASGNKTYWLDPTNGDSSDMFQAYCDMTTDSGGWMLATQSMINTEVGASVTVVKATDVNGGVGITSTINNVAGCSGISKYQVLFKDIIPWSQIRADYMFLGGNSCWGIFGNNYDNDGSNLIAFVGGTDTIYNQVKMGGSDGDAFSGVTGRCDNVTQNFWHSNQGTGTTRSATVILRRNNMGSLAGLSTGVACTAGAYPWQYKNIYLRENSMASAAVTATPAAEETGGGPLAWWKMDEGVGSSAYDSTSTKANAAFVGSTLPTWATPDMCISGNCLFFGGGSVATTNSSLTITKDLKMGNQFTISQWIRTASAGNQMYTVANAGGGSGIRFGLSGGGKIGFLLGNGGAYTESPCGSKKVNDNQWHQIVGVFDNGNNFKCYIDGKFEGQVSIGNYPGFQTSGLYIGGRPCCTVFTGYLDDTKIYNYLRSSSQISTDYQSALSNQSTSHGNSVNIGAGNNTSISNGLVAYWKLDEASLSGAANEVKDSSGNNFHGVAIGATLPTVAGGKYGNSASFNGVTDYSAIRVPYNSTLAITADVTVSAWINPSSSYVDTSQYILRDGIYADMLYSLGFNPNTRSLGFSWYDGAFKSTATGNNVIPFDTWSHVVVLRRGTTIEFYVNGVFNSSSNTGTTPVGPTPELRLGGSGSNVQDYSGLMDEVRVYNRALSASDVTQLYNFAPSPVAWWKFDDGTGTTALDASGNNINFGLSGPSGGFFTPGKYGSALKSSGGTYNHTAAHNNLLDFTSGMTFSGWIYPTVLAGNQMIIYHAGGSWLGYQLLLWSNLSNMDVRARTGDCSTTPIDHYIPTGNIPINTWTHITLTYDASLASNNLRFYKNGIFTGSDTLAGNLCPINAPLNLSSASEPFSGLYDDFKFYNYARTPAQIIQDMNANHPIGGSPVASQIAYWKFDEGLGTISRNLGVAGTALNTSLTNTTWSNDGKFNKAVLFNGSSSSASINGLSQINNSSFTISGWMKITSQPGYYSSMLMSSSAGFVLYFDQTTRHPWTQVYNGAGWFQAGCSNVSLNTGDWGYLAMTYNEDTKILNTYFNGVKCSSDVTVTNGLNDAYSTTLNIGSYAGSYHQGLIDEVKIYNSALSANDIKLDYNQGKSLVMGSLNSSVGSTNASNSYNALYCPPGNTSNCNPPVAEWQMEENKGTLLNDTSNNNNSATTYNTSWVTGKIGAALNFDGATSYADIANNSTLNFGSAFTIEAWVKQNSVANNANYNIFAKQDWSNKLGYRLAISGYGANCQNKGCLILGVGDSANRFEPDLSQFINKANTWYHLAATFNNGLITYYINGIGTSSISVGVTTLVNTAANADIGRHSSGGEFFPGIIDQVRLYNYARTPAQVALDYNRGAPLAWYKFDECQGSLLNDSSGLGNTGSISIGASGTLTSLGTCAVGTSAAWTTGAVGKRNSALSFDGVDDTASIPDVTGVTDFDVASDFTVSFWFKGDIGAANGSAVEKWSGPGGYPYVFRVGPTGNMQFARYDLTNNPSVTSKSSLTDNNWHHVVGLKNAGNIYLFIDGRLDGSNPDTTTATTLNTSPLYLGSRGGTTRFCKESIDDLRLFPYSLTSTQVVQVYNNAAVNFSPATGTP